MRSVDYLRRRLGDAHTGHRWIRRTADRVGPAGGHQFGFGTV
jgi:hypothetical protein